MVDFQRNLSQISEPGAARVPESHVGVGPEAFGQSIPQEAGSLIREGGELYAKWQDHADQAVSNSAFMKVATASEQVLNDPNTGLLNKKGFNTKDSLEKYQEAITPTITDALKDLSPRAQAYAKGKIDELKLTETKRLHIHQAEQFSIADEANTKATVEYHANMPAVFAQSGAPVETVNQQFDKGTGEILNAVVGHADRKGLTVSSMKDDPEWLKNNQPVAEMAHKEISNMGLQATLTMLSGKDTESAKQVYEHVKSYLTPEDDEKAKKAFEGVKDSEAVYALADKAMKQGGAQAALRYVNQSDADGKTKDLARTEVSQRISQGEAAQRADKENSFNAMLDYAGKHPGADLAKHFPQAWNRSTESDKKTLLTSVFNIPPVSDPSAVAKFQEWQRSEKLGNITSSEVQEQLVKLDAADRKHYGDLRQEWVLGAKSGKGIGDNMNFAKYTRNGLFQLGFAVDSAGKITDKTQVSDSIKFTNMFDQNWKDKQAQVNGRNLVPKESQTILAETVQQYLREVGKDGAKFRMTIPPKTAQVVVPESEIPKITEALKSTGQAVNDENIKALYIKVNK